MMRRFFQNLEKDVWIFEKWPEVKHFLPPVNRPWLQWMSSKRNLNVSVYSRAQSMLSKEIAKHQIVDIRYWLSIIQELRDLRKQRLLIPEGTPVSEITLK